MAVANIDAQIADLERAKVLILAVSTAGQSESTPKPKRGRKKGLPRVNTREPEEQSI